MNTYIFKSQHLYKIGKAIDVTQRLATFKTGNPFIEYVFHIEENCESQLHEIFRDKRVSGEWFNLDDDDIASIKEFEEAKKAEKEKKRLLIEQQKQKEQEEKDRVNNAKAPSFMTIDIYKEDKSLSVDIEYDENKIDVPYIGIKRAINYIEEMLLSRSSNSEDNTTRSISYTSLVELINDINNEHIQNELIVQKIRTSIRQGFKLRRAQ